MLHIDDIQFQTWDRFENPLAFDEFWMLEFKNGSPQNDIFLITPETRKIRPSHLFNADVFALKISCIGKDLRKCRFEIRLSSHGTKIPAEYLPVKIRIATQLEINSSLEKNKLI